MWTMCFHFLGTHQKRGFWELIKGKRSNRGCGNFVLLCFTSPCFSSPPPLLHHSQTRVRVPHTACDIATALLPLLLWKTGYLLPLREGSGIWQFPRIDPSSSLWWWDRRSSSPELSIPNFHPIALCSSCSSSPIAGAAHLQPLISSASC